MRWRYYTGVVLATTDSGAEWGDPAGPGRHHQPHRHRRSATGSGENNVGAVILSLR